MIFCLRYIFEWGKWWKKVGTSENVSIMNCAFSSVFATIQGESVVYADAQSSIPTLFGLLERTSNLG